MAKLSCPSTSTVIIFVLLVFSTIFGAPVSDEHGENRRHEGKALDVKKRSAAIAAHQVDLEKEADDEKETDDVDLMPLYDEQEPSFQETCVPAVEGQRCTFDICGDPQGIIRNCCQQFCAAFGGNLFPGIPFSSPSPPVLFLDE